MVNYQLSILYILLHKPSRLGKGKRESSRLSILYILLLKPVNGELVGILGYYNFQFFLYCYASSIHRRYRCQGRSFNSFYIVTLLDSLISYSYMEFSFNSFCIVTMRRFEQHIINYIFFQFFLYCYSQPLIQLMVQHLL